AERREQRHLKVAEALVRDREQRRHHHHGAQRAQRRRLGPLRPPLRPPKRRRCRYLGRRSRNTCLGHLPSLKNSPEPGTPPRLRRRGASEMIADTYPPKLGG